MDFLFEVKETIVFSVCYKLSKTGFNFYLDLLKPKLWRFERKLVYFRAQKATVNNPNHSDMYFNSEKNNFQLVSC